MTGLGFGIEITSPVGRIKGDVLVRWRRGPGFIDAAARQLGIGRPQLYAKMEEHGIKAEKE